MTLRSNFLQTCCAIAGGVFVAANLAGNSPAQAQQTPQQRPNILVIMGDDVGWFNIGAYHRGHHVREDAQPRQAGVRRA